MGFRRMQLTDKCVREKVRNETPVFDGGYFIETRGDFVSRALSLRSQLGTLPAPQRCEKIILINKS